MVYAASWFEIPVYHIDRAVEFYSTILDRPIHCTSMMGIPYAFLPDEIGGALSQTKAHLPSPNGTVVYLDCGDDLNTVLARVKRAGGNIVMGKKVVGHGAIALITDSEGNRIGLQSRY